eukprot:NODE_125_length_18781_cov_0.243015.p7 type:complete len:173 gc:universal NODE_125_length_18781_cov_0.243015:17804-18322(+)
MGSEVICGKPYLRAVPLQFWGLGVPHFFTQFHLDYFGSDGSRTCLDEIKALPGLDDSKREYEFDEFEDYVLNFWWPLKEEPTSPVLGLVPLDSVENSQIKKNLRNNFLLTSKEINAVYFPGMNRQTPLIFKSNLIGHASVDIPNKQPDRESIDYRCLVRKPTEIPQVGVVAN